MTGWSATQVEKNGSHYEVLWTNPTGKKYDVWQVNTSGNFVSSIKAKLWEDEEKFNQDINGDGDTGLVSVEATGNAYLKHGDNTYNGAPQYYIVDDTDTNIVSSHIGLTRGGAKGPTSYTGWSASQVEKNGSHYEVLWTNPTGKKYDVWKVNTSGNFVSSIKAKLWEDEEKFNQDINGDGDTGLVSVQAIGGVHLKHGDNTYNGAPQYYIVDGSNAPIGLTNAGAQWVQPPMPAGVLPKLRKMGATMKYFGLIQLVTNMMSGRLIRLATSSPVLKLSYGKMKKSLIKISMGMVTQV